MVLQRFKFYIQVYSFFLALSILKISNAVFRFQCPVQSHWKLRAETYCGFGKSYFCLYDKNEQNFTEFCRDTDDFDAPGQKLIVAGSSEGTLQGTDCDTNFYQPFKFLSSGNSRCVYKKSYCSEEGQIVYRNGTEKNDRSCRCDYTRGYEFRTRPTNPCLCVPSKEDCSCYHKTCPTKYILSPDYECLNENEWKLNFNCDSISTVVLSRDSKISLSTDNSLLVYRVTAYRKPVRVAILVFFMLILSVSIMFILPPTLQDVFYRMKRKPTDLDTVPINEVKEQFVSLIANQKSSFEKTIDAIACEKKELKKTITKLEENKGKIPSHVQELQEETKQNWTNKISNKFVVTNAAEFIYQRIKSEKVVAIIGPTGTGKSACAYYAAFKLKEEHQFVIVPVRQPSDIIQYYLPDTHQVFIMDDFIGKYAFDEAESVLWEKEGPLLRKVLSKNDQIKVILTCRKSIWHPEICKRFGFSVFVCDLHAELRLKLSETWTVCKTYVAKLDAERLNDEIIMMYTFLPSLCSIYSSTKVSNIKSFFTMPVQFIEEEMDNYKEKSHVRYMSLALLAIEQKISKQFFFVDIENENLINNLFGESGFKTLPSKKLIINHLESLTDTYVKVDNECFEFIHPTMQNIVLYCIAKTFPTSVLKYCKSDVLKNQVRLACIREEQTVPVITISTEHEEAYFTRLTKELEKGQYWDVFENNQNAFTIFTNKFLYHLNKIRKEISLKGKSDDLTVLHVLSSLGYEEFVSYFVEINNRMVYKTDAKGNTPLHLASLHGHLSIVKCLVEKSKDVHVLNNDKLSPFFYACENDNSKVVKYLLNLGDDYVKINETYMTKEHKSVLHIACLNGLNQITQILINHHATVDIKDKCGLTPLHLSCLKGHISTALLLIVSKANVNALDILQRSPIYFACTGNYKNIVELLIEHKADINQSTSTGSTPLHAACEQENLEIVNILIEHISEVNVKDKTVESSLHIACRQGNERIVNVLIDHSASVNSKTKDKLTPLHEACDNGHLNVADILLKKNANYKQKNIKGWTALFFCCDKGYKNIVTMMPNLRTDVNNSDIYGVTPLMLACRGKHINVVETLLFSKADVKQCDNDKCSPLEYACTAGNVDIVKLLLEHGALINLTNKSGITPLHAACMNKHEQVVNALIEKKADINPVDVRGETPFYKACSKGEIEIVKILLNKGAKINITDYSGKFPVAIAKENGFNSIVELLDNANTV